MFDAKKRIALLMTGVIGFGACSYVLAEGPKAREIREREEKRAAEREAKERAENKADHPEVWAAIRNLRSAREVIQNSRNEKPKYKEGALRTIDKALADLESLMARD